MRPRNMQELPVTADRLWRWRLRIEARQARSRLRSSGRILPKLRKPGTYLRPALHILRLWERGLANADAPILREHSMEFENLPPAFDRFRILIMGDVHFDGDPAGAAGMAALVEGLAYDCCVFTGDYVFEEDMPPETVYAGMSTLLASIQAPHGLYGILGNNDVSAFVPLLRDLGITMLVNEATWLENGGDRIRIVGTDDPHDFHCDNLEVALDGTPEDCFKLALVHTPERAAEAARLGINAYLCGHTHWGQICLPGGIAPTLNSRCPRKLCQGPWHCNGMLGYTTAGLGCTALPVRYNCPPEATLIEFRTKRA